MADILKMFKVVANAFLRKSACDMYPKKPAHRYPNSRGHIEIEADKCILCTLCDKRCPTHAIKVDRNGKTWAINHYKCIYCNNCVEVCPKKCLTMVQQYSSPDLNKNIVTVDIPFVIKKKPTPPQASIPATSKQDTPEQSETKTSSSSNTKAIIEANHHKDIIKSNDEKN